MPTTSGFIKWFNNSSPTGKHPFGPLTRAGIAHLYFVSIQPSRMAMAVLAERYPRRRWRKASAS
ncbi:hypothetical protein ACSTI1_00440, partial [Vibrio parahaemolyticus]